MTQAVQTDETVVVEAPARRSAEIVPFPCANRPAFIERNRAMGEKYIRHLLGQQRERLERLGVTPHRIEAEMTDMEARLLGNAAA